MKLESNSFYLGLVEKVANMFTEALDTTLFGSLTASRYDGFKSLLLPSFIFFVVLFLFTVINNWQLAITCQLKKNSLYRSLKDKLFVGHIISLLYYVIYGAVHLLPVVAAYTFMHTPTTMLHSTDDQNIIILVGCTIVFILKGLAMFLAMYVQPWIEETYKLYEISENDRDAKLSCALNTVDVLVWMYSFCEFIKIFSTYNESLQSVLTMIYNLLVIIVVFTPVIRGSLRVIYYVSNSIRVHEKTRTADQTNALVV